MLYINQSRKRDATNNNSESETSNISSISYSGMDITFQPFFLPITSIPFFSNLNNHALHQHFYSKWIKVI